MNFDTPQNEQEKVMAELKAMEVPQPALNEGEAMKYDFETRQVGDLIGIDPNSLSDYKDRIEFLMGWSADTTKSEDLTDRLYAIKKLKDSLGFTEKGATLLKKLYSYIRLNQESKNAWNTLKRISKEKELLKDGNSTSR